MNKQFEIYQKAGLLPKIGTWELDLKTGILSWDFITKSIYEVSEKYFPDPVSAINFYANQEYHERISSLVKILITTGESFTEQFQIFTNKGNVKWVETNAQAEFEKGECIKVFGTFLDITNERDLVESQKLNEEKFRQAFDYAPIGMALVSPTGKWIKVNERLCNLTGYSEEELLNLTFQDISHPADLENDMYLLQKMLTKEIDNYQIEKRYFHKNGHIVWGYLTVTLIWNRDKTPLYFISQINDITEQKKANEDLEKERHRLLQTIEGTNIGTWEWQIQEGKIIYNERWANIVGYTLEELQPISKQTWSNLVHPEDAEIPDKLLEKCFSYEYEFYSCEYRLRHKDGHWVWIHDRGKIVQWSHDGKPLLMLGTHADITQQKNNEHELKTTLDIVSEQNKRLLNFAHIISHNLRSHVGNFQMLLNFFKEETDEHRKKELIDFLMTNANSLQETVHNLNEVLQIQTNQKQQVKNINLCHEVEKALFTLKDLISENDALVHVDIPNDLYIEYTSEYIESVLFNFLTNAIKYRHSIRNPVINISTQKTEKYIILQIEDNGIGIDLKLHGQKLFGMYKTFHANKDARGLGLFITKNQIEAMSGKIEVESEVDKGTIFKVFIKN